MDCEASLQTRQAITPAETPPPTREQIDRLEDVLRSMPQAAVPVEHTFGPGFYARTIHLNEGDTLVGKVHATEHLFIVSKGDLAIATEDGVRVVQAPYQVVARPGIKRVGRALSDVTCTNVHITDETDLDKLEAMLIEHEALPAPITEECLPWHG
jgi:hypothetical protein